MSGIFKGDSIYKSGGGGGGFKDGGELIDGDFIKVENNTVSSYDNVSRDPVNFYFEVKDGEILNSVVELTTAVNATINVYVVKNGFYYLLGNVGGNTVNAGDDYKINITGDSYDIEQVNNMTVDPEFVELNGTVYPIKKINGLLWITQDYKGNIPGVTSEAKNGTVYYTNGQIPTDLNINGFRLPSNSEVSSLFTSLGGGSTAAVALRSTTTWTDGTGTNSSGFNALANGVRNAYEVWEGLGTIAMYKQSSSNTGSWRIMKDSVTANANQHIAVMLNIRLCKEV